MSPVQWLYNLCPFAELKPFIECSVVQRVIPYSSVKQFKYLTVLIQEFHVKVDLLFINEIVAMVSPELSEADAVSVFACV